MQFIQGFNFYGVKVKLFSNEPSVVENIRRDFSYFVSSVDKADFKFFAYIKEIPYEKVPQLKASLYKENAICYDDANIRYIDYHGRALAIYDFSQNSIEIYSQDENFLWELTYLAILSIVGEELDKKGIHRIHALGISVNNKAVLIILPMGGGKTTLGLELLKYDEIKLLSDDTPLITRDGKVLPFPGRIGVPRNNAVDLNIPKRYLRNFMRSKYGPKVLIDIEYFENKIAKPCDPGVILIGERIFSDECKIERISKFGTLKPFIINGVLGLGFPQLIEYLLRGNMRDILSKMGVVLPRLFASFKVINKSKQYRILTGKDRAKNAYILIEFLTKNLQNR